MKHRIAPAWLMGMSMASFGLYTGFVYFTMAQVLAGRHVAEARIASITAVAATPSFFMFVFSPILDVRFNRRSYALAFTMLSAALLAGVVLDLGNTALLEWIATAGMAAIVMAGAAISGWLTTVVKKEDERTLSAWMTVGNICGFGLMAAIGGEIVRNLPAAAAAGLFAGMTMAPTAIFAWIPVPAREAHFAGESFRKFAAAIGALARRREVLLSLALFVSPCATFSLTNMLGGLGGDFHASPKLVGLVGGAGGVAAGLVGSLLLPRLAKRTQLRPLYLAVGAVGCLFTLSLIFLPRSAGIFALAVMGENGFQSLAIACCTAITFDTVGKENPLAATNFAVLISAYNLPITYMLALDGKGFAAAGVTGAFAVDAGCGIVACALMALVLAKFRPAGPSPAKAPAELSDVTPRRP